MGKKDFGDTYMPGLTLHLKLGEIVYLGEHIAIKVIKYDGKYVSVKFKAPNELPISRESLLTEDQKKIVRKNTEVK